MTSSLSSNELAFLAQMSESAEQERHGFQVILKKYKGTNQLDKFFDALAAMNFFEAQRNPAPEPVDDDGHFRVPYWHALDYLLAVAEVAGTRSDVHLAGKVLTVVRNVSTFSASDGYCRNNYYTAHRFATILGLLPISVISEKDIDLIPGWLHGRFEMGLVGQAICQGVFVRMLTSENSNDWMKAFRIFQYCTEIQWVDSPGFLGTRKEPVVVVDDSSLKMLIDKTASGLGEKIGNEVSGLFVERLSEVFDPSRRNVPSWVLRPAIEEHPQNHAWRVAENHFVLGLRDTLLSWLNHDPLAAQAFIREMLVTGPEIGRRIGIYIISRRWDILRELCSTVLVQDFFDFEYLHETYGFLKEHFAEFSPLGKEKVVHIIRNLPIVHELPEAQLHLMAWQRDWLTSVVGQGYEPADKWYSQLTADASLGSTGEHPDFNAWNETFTGSGTSPFQAEELISFAQLGDIVETLNRFEPPDTWQGPTVQGLVKALEDAVQIRPDLFLSLLPKFLMANRPYQYGIVNGFKRHWDAGTDIERIDWDQAWEGLFTFFEALVTAHDFWEERVPTDQGPMFLLTPNKNWIITVIVDFLGAATRDDAKAYPVPLLARGWALLKILLEYAGLADAIAADPMSQALNTQKGRVLNAIYLHALRVCRVTDGEKRGHEHAWSEMMPVFDAEISCCGEGNYEFFTLTGYFAASFEYLAPDWFITHIAEIFPSTPHRRTNLLCALDGLAYAQKTRWLYRQLAENDVVDLALRSNSIPWNAQQYMLDILALAYLWGDEGLDSHRLKYLFDVSRVNYLKEIARFFWSLRGQRLTESQVGRIIEFWNYSVNWASVQEASQSELLSSLGPLTCYLKDIGEQEQRLLIAVAPFVASGKTRDFLGYLFIEELDRLATSNPREIEQVLGTVLAAFTPIFDFQDHLKSIIRKLAEAHLVTEARNLINQLRDLPGMIDLLREIDVIRKH